MPHHHYYVEEPVRLSRSWATALSGLVGIGLGIAGTILLTPAPPAPAPAPIVVVPTLAAHGEPVVKPNPEFDSSPWVSTLRAGIVEIKSSLGEMPTLKAPAYKIPFEAITSKVEALELSVNEFEQAAQQHKTEPAAPAAPMGPSSQPKTSP